MKDYLKSISNSHISLSFYPVMYEKIRDLKDVEIAFFILINTRIIRLKQVLNAA